MASSPEHDFARFRREGDATALAAVFDRLAPELLLVATHVGPRTGDAEDLVQATFLDAIEKADRWDAARPLMPWLIGILVNHARLLRRQRARTPDPARLQHAEEASPPEAAAAAEVAERVAAAVRALPRHYRQVLTLRLVHGLMPQEIARALGSPIATVKTRLQRGTDMLRKALPSGIAAGLAGLVTTGPGLAAVRTAVLARAAALAPTGAGALVSGTLLTQWLASLTGVLAMKKTILAALAVVLAAVTWAVVPLGDAPLDLTPMATPTVAEAAAAATAQPGPADDLAAATDRQRADRRVDGPAAGAIDLEFVWSHDGSPAAALQVSAKDGAGRDLRWRADQDGRVRSPLSAGDFFLFGSKLWHRITVLPGDTTREQIEVEPGLLLSGIVVDEHGRGVPGAEVAVQYFADPQDSGRRLIARSRADGRFEAALDFGGSLWASKPGHAPSRCEPVDGDRNDIYLVLPDTASTVRGVVRRSDGAPAAAADLILVQTSERDRLAAPVALRADENGTFWTDQLAPGDHRLVALADGHAATPMDFHVEVDRHQLLHVQLDRGAVIHGTVTKAGAPARARVTIRPTWAGGGDFALSLHPLYHRCTITTETAADGRYRIEHVPAGELDIEVAEVDGTAHAERMQQMYDGAELQCDFELPRQDELRGEAVDAAGLPLVGWTVTASPNGGGHVRTAETDGAGRFVLAGIDAPGYSLQLRPDDGFRVPWLRRLDLVPDGRPLRLELPWRQDEGGWFTGTVVDDRGAPVQEAGAWVTRGEDRTGDHVRLGLDDDGAFRLGPLPPGTWQLRIRIEGKGTIALGAHDLPAGGTVAVGTARLPAAGTLELGFAFADGRAADATQVLAFDRIGNGGPIRRGDDGVFRSEPLPAGTYRVRAWGADFAQLERDVAVVAERASPSTLTVTAAAPIRFVVTIDATDAADAAPPGARVQLQLQGQDGTIVAAPTLDLDGGSVTWTRGLPPGDYRYAVRVLPDGPATEGALTVDADLTPRRIDVSLPRPR